MFLTMINGKSSVAVIDASGDWRRGEAVPRRMRLHWKTRLDLSHEKKNTMEFGHLNFQRIICLWKWDEASLGDPSRFVSYPCLMKNTMRFGHLNFQRIIWKTQLDEASVWREGLIILVNIRFVSLIHWTQERIKTLILTSCDTMLWLLWSK